MFGTRLDSSVQNEVHPNGFAETELAREIAGTPAPQTPDHAQNNRDALKRAEEEIRQERLALLAIEDPVEYERQLRDEDLIDGEPSTDGDSDAE